ncbi:hypothetical protein ILYODFUR_038635 [Ilyodon furcidens]|uniref:Uncharacterized protein n=1 Tax=Ilyodon furcidens TaxID=33524 RepID=A0ABV0VAI8_9TELE
MRERCLATATLERSLRRRSLSSYKCLLEGYVLIKRHWKCFKILHDCDSGVQRDSDGSWSAFSSSDSGSESEPPRTKNMSRPVSRRLWRIISSNSATISAGSETGRRARCPVPSYKPSSPAHWQERN